MGGARSAAALVCYPRSAPGRGGGQSSPHRPPAAFAATTYSCSAVRHAVGVCVATGWRGRVSRQGTWGSRRTGHAATGSMVTAATVDASAVRSAGRYRLIPAVFGVRCLQAAVQSTTPQFMRSVSAASALLLPIYCTVVVASSEGPCSRASRPCPGGRAGWAGCRKPCRPGAPGAWCTGSPRGAPGPPIGGRGVGAGTSGPARWTGFWSASHCPTTPLSCGLDAALKSNVGQVV